MNITTRKTLSGASLIGLALVGVAVIGCGGATSPPRSRATATILWPAVTRLIPDATKSITVSFLQGTTVVATQTVARPASNTQSVLTFASLPLGALTATAAAYSTTNGTGVALARLSTSTTIVAGQTSAVGITLVSTIDHLSVSPLNPSVTFAQTLPLILSGVDSSGNQVLMTASHITWESLTPTIATVSATGVVTGVLPGTAQIRATETESGKTVTVTVTVTDPIL